MVPTYIRFLFAYANSDQNGDGCQGVGCCCLLLWLLWAVRWGPVPGDNPNFLLADNPEVSSRPI